MAKQYKEKGYFLQIAEDLMTSRAYRDLKPPARALLFEFARIYRPRKNGQLFISTRQSVEWINVTEPVALRAFAELASHGFIKLTNHENWQERKARHWALTFKPVAEREPTNEWKQWTPDADLCPLPTKKRSAKKLKSRPMETGAVLPMKPRTACL